MQKFPVRAPSHLAPGLVCLAPASGPEPFAAPRLPWCVAQRWRQQQSGTAGDPELPAEGDGRWPGLGGSRVERLDGWRRFSMTDPKGAGRKMLT